MEKALILVETEMKEEIAEVLNKYIGQIPAMHIASAFESFTKELNTIAKEQLESARKQYAESQKEVAENDSE